MKKERKINIYSVLMRTVLYFSFFIVIFLGILHLPYVQTKIVNAVVDRLTGSMNGTIVIGRTSASIYSGVSLNDIVLLGSEQDTLLTLESARISPKNTLLTLLTEDVAFNDILFTGGRLTLHRKANENKYNWEKFMGIQDADQQNKKKSSPPFISSVRLNDFKVDWKDDKNKESVEAKFISFEVDINSIDLEDEGVIDISRILLYNPVIIYDRFRNENIEVLKNDSTIVSASLADSSSLPKIRIGNLSMIDGNLKITQDVKDDLNFGNLDLNIKDLYLEDIDQWSLSLDKVSGESQKDKLRYASIRKITRSGHQVLLENAAVNLNDSKLKFDGSLENVTGIADLSWSTAKLNIRPSTFYIKDLFTILPEFKEKFGGEPIAQKRLQVEGNFEKNHFKYKGSNISVWLNGLHHFEGSVAFDQSVNIERSTLNATVTSLKTDITDLANLSSKFKIPQELSRLETVNFSGSFDGFLNDFVANGLVISPLGKANMDIKFDLSGENESAISYDGFLALDSFNLNKMTLNDDFGYVTAQVNISNGAGADLSSSSADIKAVIDRFEFKDFAYEDAVYEGTLSSRVIDGHFSIRDEELDFEFDGIVNFSDSIPVFDFKVVAEKINFCQLNITDFPCELSFSSDINLKGYSLNNLDGTAVINNAVLRHDTSSLLINEIAVLSIPGEVANSFELKSDFVDFDIEGRFNLLKVFQNSFDLLIHNVNEHNEVWNFKLNGGESIQQKYRYSLLLKDATPLFEFANIDINQKGYANISGGQNDVDGAVDMKAMIPFVAYKDISADSLFIDINSTEGFANVETKLYNIQRGNLQLSELKIEADLKNDIANWNIFYNYDDYNTARLSAHSRVNKEGYYTKFLDDDVTIDSSKWKILSDQGVGIYPGMLDIEDFSLSDGLRFVSLKDIDNRGLEISMNDFELGFINSIINYDKTILTGRIKSRIRFDDIYKDLALQGYVDVEDFKINGDDFGHLLLKAQRGLDNNEVIDLDLSIEKDTQNLYARGYADIGSSYLNVDLTLEDYPMSFFEYIIEDGISETVGTTDITAKLHGPIDNIKLSGKGLIKNAGVKVDYLGAFYRMEDQTVMIDEKFIDFNGVQLIDELGNTAEISGGLRHNMLADIRADLDIRSPRFIGLNTTYSDNPLYYGIGVGEIDISFQGPFDAIDIAVVAKLQNLSRLYIPLSSTAYTYEESFIVFNNTRDTIQKAGTESLAEILKDQGVDFELSLTFTPDAIVSVIYDETTSNVLEGTGAGNVQLNVKRDGEFTAYGNYNISSGRYLYTAYGLIAKPFDIRNGGTVTWTGDPLNATLNVTAEYPGLRAPLTNFLSEFAGTFRKDELNLDSRIDIDLNLILTGQLFNPKINFDIDFPNLTGQVRTLAQNKVRTLKATENGINNQVVGLLIFSNFLPDNNGLTAISSSEVGQSGNNTITQFLTSQLSLLFSDYLSSKLGEDDFISDIDFEIAVAQNNSLLGEDANLFEGLLDVVPDEVQLNLRNHFKNDNFVLNLGGNYVRENQIGRAENYVTGDFSLDWYITDDRRLKLRFYGNYDYDDAFSTRRQRYGFGINFRREFGSLSDFQQVLDEMIRQIQDEGNTSTSSGK